MDKKRIMHVCMCKTSDFNPESVQDVIDVLNAHQRQGVQPITQENTEIVFDERFRENFVEVGK